LFLGTIQDNTTDMVFKGRQRKAKGVDNGCAKLTEQDVFDIRRKIKLGFSLRELGREYSVYHTAIHKIKIGESWTHI